MHMIPILGRRRSNLRKLGNFIKSPNVNWRSVNNAYASELGLGPVMDYSNTVT